MKKILLFLLLISVQQKSIAQITIVSGDLPAAGDTFRVSNGQQFAGMDATLTGANYTWDYSQLTPITQQVDTFWSVASTAQIFSIVFLLNSNQATSGNSFSLLTVNVSNVFNFFNRSSTSYKQTGFGANVNGVPLPVSYSPHDFVYRLPLHFNDLDSSDSGYQIDLTTTLGLYLQVRRHRVNTVDGWGTLITPFGTFNTLRVKSTVTEQDSVYYSTIGVGLNLPPITNLEYKWLGTNGGIPLLQVNTGIGGAVTSVVYQDSLRSTLGITSVDDAVDFSLFPNPVTASSRVRFNLVQPANALVSLYDLSGKLVHEFPAQNLGTGKQEIPVMPEGRSLPKGNYLLRIQLNDKNYLEKLSVE